MADVLNSYGELYFYKYDLEKAEKFHLEALALWEIHSEENDWKILNQIIYLVDVYKAILTCFCKIIEVTQSR